MTEEILKVNVWEINRIRVRRKDGTITESPLSKAAHLAPFPELTTSEAAVAQLAQAIQYLSGKGVDVDVGFSITVRKEDSPRELSDESGRVQ